MISSFCISYLGRYIRVINQHSLFLLLHVHDTPKHRNQVIGQTHYPEYDSNILQKFRELTLTEISFTKSTTKPTPPPILSRFRGRPVVILEPTIDTAQLPRAQVLLISRVAIHYG